MIKDDAATNEENSSQVRSRLKPKQLILNQNIKRDFVTLTSRPT